MIIKKFLDLAKKDLFPLNRSLTGMGTLKTLNIIKKNFNSFKIKYIKSGEKVYDWRIPKQWEITSAYVIDKFGRKIIDFSKTN